MSIYKDSNETIKHYKVRLCKNKALYGLTFNDIAELLNKETGESKSESFFRKWWNGYNEGYLDASTECMNTDKILVEYEKKRIEFEKEKNKFLDYRNAYKKEIRDDSRKEILLEILLDKINCIKPYDSVKINYKSSNNDLLVGLNDIHFGIDIDNYWNKYNSEIAKKRLEKYIDNIINIQKVHNSENCYVCANGDLISGNIHYTIQIANRENIVEQIIGVSELIAWFLSELGKYFNNVYLSVVSGNHSRLSMKENSQKNERLDDLIPWYIKARLQNIKNIFVLDNCIDSTLNIVNIRGLNYLNVHGDYDNFTNIQRLIEMLDEDIYCIHFGHLHHNMTDYIQKYKIIMSGSLQGVDDYCIQKRIYSHAQQLVCVCNDKGIICSYDVDLQ